MFVSPGDRPSAPASDAVKPDVRLLYASGPPEQLVAQVHLPSVVSEWYDTIR